MNMLNHRVALLTGLLAPGLLWGTFVDKAQISGVDLNYPTVVGVHTDPSLDSYSTGNAASACDLDGDGWTDVIIARSQAPCLVFMNNHDGTFREEAHLRGLDTVSDIGGIAAGDLSNKGSVDIFMAPASGRRYYLFVNDGTGHFQEVAVDRGADVPVTLEDHRGQSVSMVDYDRDGYLDIYVCEWRTASSAENAQHSVLLHNKGAAAPGHFENKTAAAGLVQPVVLDTATSFAALWADYDGDGYPDLYLVADNGASQMYWNNGNGTFTNGTAASGLTNSLLAMGGAVVDYDGDGKPDIFVSGVTFAIPRNPPGYTPLNLLYRNLGNRQFQEVGTQAGVSQSGWAWGAESLDMGNKGSPDLLVTNGFTGSSFGSSSPGSDPTALFVNNGGTFSNLASIYGITDTGTGRSVTVFDYDNDGREDALITQTVGHRLLYHNETSTANAHWLALRFVGATSNRDGYGCLVTITAGGHNQTAVYNPTSAYIGQREPRLHFGLGASTVVDKVTITWPSGTVQTLTNVAAGQLLTVNEITALVAAPTIVTSPASVAAVKDSTVTLTVVSHGFPAPVYVWYKDGTTIAGQVGASLTLNRIQPVDQGTYTVSAINQYGTATSAGAVVTVTANIASKSVARWWDEALLDGIRKDTPNPPVHARNLYHLSGTLWDSYWAFERNGWDTRHEVFVKQVVSLPADEPTRLAAQSQAMSYAAYTVIKKRFANSPGKVATLAGIRWLMQQLGYDPDFADATGTSPASIGLQIGQQVVALTIGDGANEANGYADASGFTVANPSLKVVLPGVGVAVNPNNWQPLDLVNTITQNGIVLGPSVQKFVGANARNTRTFALAHSANGFLVDDPGAPPRFGGTTTAEYISQAMVVLTDSSELTPTDGVTLDISPGHILNNPLGTNDGHGHPSNPVTGQPYASNVVNRGDFARVLAEFWADGPNSETPPGHWNVLFNQVSDNPLCTHQFQGVGAALPRMQWDVCGYLALNGALHDAACTAWTLKWEYNSSRPITMIRYLAALGQSTDATLANYNPNGLPLIPGQIEVITAQSSAPGQRHAQLADFVGQIAVRAWLGTPPSPTITSGVGWILGINWVPYQLNTFVTPAFPAFSSGHSTFSRAGAEVLTRLTGNSYFPGGLATFNYPIGKLAFEFGPAQPVQLQWATYYDAADQAGLSRLFGGIHIPADDFTGRKMGSKVGNIAFDKFLTYLDSANPPVIADHPAAASATPGRTATFTITATSAQTFTYQWQRMPAGGTWVNLTNGGSFSGATSAKLTISTTPGMNGDQYRCVVTNTSGSSSTSNAGTLTLTAAVVDFSADGRADLFWQNGVTGERYVWAMNGTAFLAGGYIATVPTDWTVAAVADFNSDAQPDLLWQNTINGERAVWLMNGTNFVSGIGLGVVPTDWSIAGAGDFNGDGQPDIVWQNTVTGERCIWFMNGTTFQSGFILGVVPTDWSIATVGDFNGDGNPDIVWQNTVTGERSIWLMSGTGFVSGASLGVVPPEWSIAGTGDFNGDGQMDIIWQNTVTGERAIWLMNGTVFTSGVSLGVVPVQWSIRN